MFPSSLVHGEISRVILHAGQGDAQTVASLSQCCFGLLCWQPAAAGADPQAVQHQPQDTRHRQAFVARGAVNGQLHHVATFESCRSLNSSCQTHQLMSCCPSCDTDVDGQALALPILFFLFSISSFIVALTGFVFSTSTMLNLVAGSQLGVYCTYLSTCVMGIGFFFSLSFLNLFLCSISSHEVSVSFVSHFL